jgi:hypothetical protein
MCIMLPRFDGIKVQKLPYSHAYASNYWVSFYENTNTTKHSQSAPCTHAVEKNWIGGRCYALSLSFSLTHTHLMLPSTQKWSNCHNSKSSSNLARSTYELYLKSEYIMVCHTHYVIIGLQWNVSYPAKGLGVKDTIYGNCFLFESFNTCRIFSFLYCLVLWLDDCLMQHLCQKVHQECEKCWWKWIAAHMFECQLNCDSYIIIIKVLDLYTRSVSHKLPLVLAL